MTEWQPIVRIVLRYLSGAAVSWGLLAPGEAAAFTAPHVVAAVAGAVGLAVELAYARAKRSGGAT